MKVLYSFRGLQAHPFKILTFVVRLNVPTKAGSTILRVSIRVLAHAAIFVRFIVSIVALFFAITQVRMLLYACWVVGTKKVIQSAAFFFGIWGFFTNRFMVVALRFRIAYLSLLAIFLFFTLITWAVFRLVVTLARVRPIKIIVTIFNGIWFARNAMWFTVAVAVKFIPILCSTNLGTVFCHTCKESDDSIRFHSGSRMLPARSSLS